MQPNSLRTRGVSFAYLFGPPRLIDRNEASRVHGGVCDRLKLDDLSFQYNCSEPAQKPSSRGFAIIMQRQEGRGVFRIVVDHPGAGNPIRLFLEWVWPPSNIHVNERFDEAAEAVLDGGLEGQWQRVMAEARLRAQCDVKTGGSLAFLTDEVPKFSATAADTLGTPLTFVTIGLHTTPTTQTDQPLIDPARELTIEILREDPKVLYLELVSKWTQVPIGTTAVALNQIRPIAAKPSEYIENAQTALCDWVSAVAGNKRDSK